MGVKKQELFADFRSDKFFIKVHRTKLYQKTVLRGVKFFCVG
jgi:hypothetical protein